MTIPHCDVTGMMRNWGTLHPDDRRMDDLATSFTSQEPMCCSLATSWRSKVVTSDRMSYEIEHIEPEITMCSPTQT